MSSYFFYAHGLSWLSDAPIPGFPTAHASVSPPDVAVEVSSEPPCWVQLARRLASSVRYRRLGHLEDVACTFTVFGHDHFFELTYSGEAQFVIDRLATRLWAACPSPFTLDDLAVYLRGPVSGLILRLRGVTALHSSSVCIDGRAISLCGVGAAGKSTTAAALALRGAPVLAEDLSPIKVLGNNFVVQSGYPRICLWPDSVKELLGSANCLPHLTPNWDKCYLPLDGIRAYFEPQPKPLGAIYLLDRRSVDSDAPRLEEMSSREAILALVQNTYMNWVLDRDQRAAEFDVLSKIVTQIPVRRLIPHADPGRLQALCDLIIEDAMTLTTPTCSRTFAPQPA